jgi:hypothetical protein
MFPLLKNVLNSEHLKINEAISVKSLQLFTFIPVGTVFQSTGTKWNRLELSKRYIYFDYFHKVAWIWGARKTVISNRKPSSLLPKYPSFCSMIKLNLYCGCILSILLMKLRGSEKDPEVNIVGVFFHHPFPCIQQERFIQKL